MISPDTQQAPELQNAPSYSIYVLKFLVITILRAHRMQCISRQATATEGVAWSVSVSADHGHKPCKND